MSAKSMYERSISALYAAQEAGVEPKEIRLNISGFDHMIAERQSNPILTFGDRGGDRKCLGLPIVIEKQRVDDGWAAHEAAQAGDGTLPIEQPTVCVAGIGKLGRWEYFDA